MCSLRDFSEGSYQGEIQGVGGLYQGRRTLPICGTKRVS